jgi:ABC-type amino acid transport substrate-binding protein
MRSGVGATTGREHLPLHRQRWFWLLAAIGCWLLALRWVYAAWYRGHTGPTWERLQRSGVARVCMDATYPPFELQDEAGAFSGYDVDLARELATCWGVRAEFINVHFDGLYDALLAGKCDLLLSALPYDETLTEDVLFSPSYFNAGLLLTIREDERRIRNTNGLAGKNVGVELGTGAHLEARRLREQARIPLEIVTFRSAREALEALHAGSIDAAIADSVAVYRFVHDPGGIRHLRKFLTDEQYVIAMHPHSGHTWNMITDELVRMQKEGFLEALGAKWFQ